MRLMDIPQIKQARYRIDMPIHQVQDWIDRHTDTKVGMTCDLSPDYQRDHVWTRTQASAYMEWILRGGTSGREIYWNHPHWMNSWKGVLELVDGKQRIKAVTDFFDNKLKVFGLRFKEFEGGDQGLWTVCLSFNIADLKTRAEVLKWYIDMNAGGTMHKKREIDKVRQLLEEVTNEDSR